MIIYLKLINDEVLNDQLFISIISEDELLLFEIILWCYQHYQNEIRDIIYLISNYMINLFIKIRYQKFEFRFE